MVTTRVTRLVFSLWAVLQLFPQGTNAQGTTGTSQKWQTTTEMSSFFYHQSEYPRDCKEVHDRCSSSATSGVYVIRPNGFSNPSEVYCDNAIDSGGWTVIQRRQLNGTIDFNRDWDSYTFGFGFLSHEFWIGHELLSYLTNQKEYELLIEVTISSGSTFNQSYSNFRISDGFSNYKLLSAIHLPAFRDPITWCPANMVYGNCTCGQRHCGDPATCEDTCDGDLTEGCVCPEGNYMQDGDCVPEDQCRCYIEAERTLLPENNTYVNDGCTTIARCSGGELVVNDGYQCSSNAVCEERDGVRRCYCNVGYNGDGQNCSSSDMGIDCQAVYDAGHTDNGVYRIRPTNWPGTAFDVYCNMTANGEGWTVFQRRIDGTVDFDVYWSDYREGFGEVDHEHWLGNEQLHYLTNQRNYELRIDMVYKNGNPYYAEYDSFRINDEADNYRLSSLGTYSGNSGYNGLYYSPNQQFTTRDRDNDGWGSDSCATHSSYFRGGWWYNSCGYSGLNGIYSTSACSYNSITWYYYYCNYYNLKYVEMKIRPV